MTAGRKLVALNMNAVFYMSQLAGKTMLAQKYGKIINIASMTAFFASVLIPAYSASKGGVAQITKALSNEWAGQGVNVNAIAPGYMATELTANIKEVNPKQYEEITKPDSRGALGQGWRICRDWRSFWHPMHHPIFRRGDSG